MSTAEWFAAVIIGLGTAIVNKIWNKSADKTAKQQADLLDRCKVALDVARSVMSQIVLTAKPDATLDWVIQQCKGAVAIQMAKLRAGAPAWAVLVLDSPTVGLLIDDAIAAAAKRFVELHPAPQTLTLPIAKKIGAQLMTERGQIPDPGGMSVTVPGVGRVSLD